LEKGGEVAYQLELLPQLSDVHDIFRVSQLKKCLCVPEEQIPMEDLDAKQDHSYQEYSINILEMYERVTRNKSHQTEEEATSTTGKTKLFVSHNNFCRLEGKLTEIM
jgi:hypothetical protein